MNLNCTGRVNSQISPDIIVNIANIFTIRWLLVMEDNNFNGSKKRIKITISFSYFL